MTTEIPKGTVVEFTATLGLVDHPEDSKFRDEVVERGDRGTYIGPHPNPMLGDDWHLVSVDLPDGGKALCPCHLSLFAAVESS